MIKYISNFIAGNPARMNALSDTIVDMAVIFCCLMSLATIILASMELIKT